MLASKRQSKMKNAKIFLIDLEQGLSYLEKKFIFK